MKHFRRAEKLAYRTRSVLIWEVMVRSHFQITRAHIKKRARRVCWEICARGIGILSDALKRLSKSSRRWMRVAVCKTRGAARCGVRAAWARQNSRKRWGGGTLSADG